MFDKIKSNAELWESLIDISKEIILQPKTILLREGETSNYIYYIKVGSLRLWHNKEGKDITFQFFFENQVVTSIDSMVSNQPSLFSIETIERSIVMKMHKNDLKSIQEKFPALKDEFNAYVFGRLRIYTELFLSRIKDSPKERFEELRTKYPEILQRIPQIYIASYLGITPISLSRIKNKKTSKN